jgi:large subunit ribosomal protein L10
MIPERSIILPITRQRKEEFVALYNELLQVSSGFAIVSTRGLAVNKIEALRRKIKDAGGQYAVTKNTLMTKALEQSGWVVPSALLQEQTAIVFGKDNFPGVAKALLDFIEAEKLEEDKMKVVGGVMGNDILNADGVKAVSQLPTLPELQAQIIGLIVQPAINLVSILEAADAGIVNVLQALLDKDENKDNGEAA